MKLAIVVVALFLSAIGSIVAQSDAPPAQAAPMQCPMMSMMNMPGHQMAGMEQTPGTMADRMADMLTLSGDELQALLTGKDAALGLSDAQAKRVTDVLEKASRQKIATHMQHMKGQMGSCACPCCAGK